MDSKFRVLGLLEENKGAFVSGAFMARELKLTRGSVWKAIESLRKEGYGITGVSKKGYRLESSGDMLSPAGIIRHVKTGGVFLVETRKLVTSTNTVLREEAAKGAPEGYVLAAESQTEGKGRQGRKWFSPAGHATYFSVLLRPNIKAEKATLITAAAAVASANAIESVFGIRVGIKWVNDLFYNGKKVSGILTEATIDMESGMVDNAVVGIGINVTKPTDGYPPRLRDIAGAITDRANCKDNERCRLIAAVMDNFWAYYMDLSQRDFLDEYRKRSILLGREVSVAKTYGVRNAVALEIDDDCGLVVRYEDGVFETIRTGEVKLRKEN